MFQHRFGRGAVGYTDKTHIKTLDERKLANSSAQTRSTNLETDAEHQHHSEQQQMKFRNISEKSKIQTLTWSKVSCFSHTSPVAVT